VARRGSPFVWIAGVAGTLWLIFPYAFPNYDTLYALVWGAELGQGTSPDYGAFPPTPHPLANLWGAVVSVLGVSGANTATTVLAYLTLGAIAYLVYRLGALWFDRPIGVVAALIVFTRPGIITNGLLAYIDMPFIALCLSALLIETRRERAGWPVLALLALAGLLRPEAWLFSAVYLAYLALERNPDRGRWVLRRRPGPESRELAGWFLLAAAAPLLWGAFDLLVTGDPLYSLTATKGRVADLERETGLVPLIVDGPHRLGEMVQRQALIGAGAGLVLGFALMRRRALIGIEASVLAGFAFAVLACGGLAIISRYTMLLSIFLCIFCALSLLGWRLLTRGHRWRRTWQWIAVAVAVIQIAYMPQLFGYISSESEDIESQSRLQDDLHEIVDSSSFERLCTPITVTSDRAIPRLASWLGVRPSEIGVWSRSAEPSRGSFLKPASAEARVHYLSGPVPAGFRPVARNESWLLYARCG